MSLDKPRKIFPDMGSLVAYMDKARENHDEELRAQYEEMYERSHFAADGWGTHAPLLASVIATAAPGPVLEIGVGRGSSPILVEMCKAMGRHLIGLDSDKHWLGEMRDLNYPQLVHFPDWSKLDEWIETKNFAVIFIDHGPGEARLPVLKSVRGHADYIVCHDTHNPNYLIGFDDELDTFKYRHDYTLMPSCTSVVSDLFPYVGAT